MLTFTPSATGGGELTGEVSIGVVVMEKYDSVDALSSSSDGVWVAKGAAVEGCAP